MTLQSSLHSCHLVRNPFHKSILVPSADLLRTSASEALERGCDCMAHLSMPGHWLAYESVFLRSDDRSWFSSLCGKRRGAMCFKHGCYVLSSPRGVVSLEGCEGGVGISGTGSLSGAQLKARFCLKFRSSATDSPSRSAQRRPLIYRVVSYSFINDSCHSPFKPLEVNHLK